MQSSLTAFVDALQEYPEELLFRNRLALLLRHTHIERVLKYPGMRSTCH